MGVNLSGLVEARSVELADLNGKTIAIDAYNTIYQFLSIIRQPDGRPLQDTTGRTSSHLSGLLYRTSNLIQAGIEPSFVFDGKPHELKMETLRGRRERREKATKEWEEAVEEGDMKKAFSKAQQTSVMTDDIRDSSKQLLKAMGLPVIQAPSDGEAQGAYMCMKNSVWAAASQDYDSLLFGAPNLVRNVTITGRRKQNSMGKYKDIKTEIIESDVFLQSLDITREQLVDLCILMGTDFNPGINGIGPKKGLKLVKLYGDLEHILPKIDEDVENYDKIRSIFLDSEYSDDYDVNPKPIDREAVLELMVSRDFSEDRVNSTIDRIEEARKVAIARKRQRSLDAWF